MVYLIFGNQTPTIKKRLNSIVKEKLPQKDDINFVQYDGSLTLIQECIDDANSLPLGYEHKVVVINSCYFLLKHKPRNKIESDQNYEALKQFIENPSSECDVILVVNSSDVDKKGDIFASIQKKGKTFEILDPTPDQWKSYVCHYCREIKNIRIDNDAVMELCDRTSGDVALFQNSLNKLELYTDHITYDDVVLMVTRPLEENAFLIFNYLLQGKNSAVVGLYRDLKTANVEPVTLISMLSNQFRLLNQISFLAKKGQSKDEIASQLRINPIRAQILLRSVHSINQECLNQTLEDLFNLDLEIKSGLIDRYYAFELFLINFKCR